MFSRLHIFLVTTLLFVSGGCTLKSSVSGGSKSKAISLVKITSTSPSQGNIEVDLRKHVIIVFDADLDPATVTATNIEVKSCATVLSGTLAYDSPTKTVTFTPSADYPESVAITVAVKAGLKKADGTTSVQAATWSFSTLTLSDLIAHWRFDGNADDSSGNGHHLTANNMTYDSTEKIQGTASAQFDGTSSYFNIGQTDLGPAFTITVWVYMPTPVQNSINTIIANTYGNDHNNGFKLFINEYNTQNLKVCTEIGNGSVGGKLTTQANFVTTGEWRHLAFVIDKSQPAASRGLIYYDGVLATQTFDGSNGGATEIVNNFSTNEPMEIGRMLANQFYFSGRMDDFRIYSGALSSTEITKIASQN